MKEFLTVCQIKNNSNVQVVLHCSCSVTQVLWSCLWNWSVTSKVGKVCGRRSWSAILSAKRLAGVALRGESEVQSGFETEGQILLEV